MRVKLSAFAFDGGKSGVSSYILGLLSGLRAHRESLSCSVLINQNDTPYFSSFGDFAHVCPYLPSMSRPLVNHLYHNIALPFSSCDILHVPTIRRVPVVKGMPVVATVHDMAPLALTQKYDPLRQFYFRQILTRMIHRVDHLIAVSEHTKNDVIRFTGYPEDKIEVVRSGLDFHFYSSFSEEQSLKYLKGKYAWAQHPFLVYVSRLEHPGKNHVRLIKAFNRLRKGSDVPYQLVIAGAEWSGAEAIYEAAGASQFSDSIHFVGFVSREEVAQLYTACALMVFPSLYEGFGFPLIEAFAAGAPVACSGTTALRELGEGHALMFDPLSVENMTDVIAKALMQKRGEQRSYASSFSWEETARQVIDVYKKSMS